MPEPQKKPAEPDMVAKIQKYAAEQAEREKAAAAGGKETPPSISGLVTALKNRVFGKPAPPTPQNPKVE